MHEHLEEVGEEGIVVVVNASPNSIKYYGVKMKKKRTLQQYLVILQPRHVFRLSLGDLCSCPISGNHKLHPEQVSCRCAVSSTHTSGLSTRSISTPGGIASEANRLVPASEVFWV